MVQHLGVGHLFQVDHQRSLPCLSILSLPFVHSHLEPLLEYALQQVLGWRKFILAGEHGVQCSASFQLLLAGVRSAGLPRLVQADPCVLFRVSTWVQPDLLLVHVEDVLIHFPIRLRYHGTPLDVRSFLGHDFGLQPRHAHLDRAH